MDGRETPGNKTVRLGKEALIKDYFNAHDMTKVNEVLDTYPHGSRPEISIETAHHIAKVASVATQHGEVDVAA